MYGKPVFFSTGATRIFVVLSAPHFGQCNSSSTKTLEPAK